MVEPETCHFLYDISVAKFGVINSPFFNRLYPANTTCRYDIVGNGQHRIRIYFHEFSLSEIGVRRQKYHSLRNSTCEGVSKTLAWYTFGIRPCPGYGQKAMNITTYDDVRIG